MKLFILYVYCVSNVDTSVFSDLNEAQTTKKKKTNKHYFSV